MVQSQAETVADYLAELPAERRKALQAVRKVIRTNLPKGYVELMQYGMIGYAVPLALYPRGYLNDPEQPLPYAGLASQKNYMSVYLMSIYDVESVKWFREAYKKAGKKLDMGKCCVRFKTLDDLPLDLIGEAVARVPVAEFIKRYEAARKK